MDVHGVKAILDIAADAPVARTRQILQTPESFELATQLPTELVQGAEVDDQPPLLDTSLRVPRLRCQEYPGNPSRIGCRFPGARLEESGFFVIEKLLLLGRSVEQ